MMKNGGQDKVKIKLQSPVLKQQRASNPFQVICRIRPQDNPEKVSDIAIDQEKCSIFIKNQAKNNIKEFAFHRIYNEHVTQNEFTSEIIDEIFQTASSRKDSLVLGYGVTNSGKTYTILGTEEQPGLLPVLLGRIFQEFPDQEVDISAIELYNDEFYSLMDRGKLFTKEINNKYAFQEFEPEKASHQNLRDLIRIFTENRSQNNTKANKKSSRSHAIFKIECDAISVAIVDLAGSQRMHKASYNIQETASINIGLLTLGKCIHAFRDRAPIPFRECKLTKLLAEYFGEDFKIFMIAHINRTGEMFHENLNVLDYASIGTRVKHMNNFVNQSIAKSHKRQNKSKSVLKHKSILESEAQEAKKDHKRNVKIQEERDELLQLMRQDSARMKRERKQKYINLLIGRQEEFNFYLDQEFARLDQQDAAFIDKLRNTKWENPFKKKEARFSIDLARERIKMRQEILDEIQQKKVQHMTDVATEPEEKWSNRKKFEEILLKSEKKVEGQKIEPVEEDKENYQIEKDLEEEGSQSFLNRVVDVSAKKMKQIVSSAYNLFKSHSNRKKKSSKKKQYPSFVPESQVDEVVNRDKKPELEERGCGSFNVNGEDEEQKRFTESLNKILSGVKDQVENKAEEDPEREDSQLLDACRFLEEPEKKELTEIRQSDEYQTSLLKKKKEASNQIPDEITVNIFQKEKKDKEKKPQLSQDSTTIFKRQQKSTSVSSYDQDSTSSQDHPFKKGKGKNRSKDRHPMEFRVKKHPAVSPVKTRSQKNRVKLNYGIL